MTSNSSHDNDITFFAETDFRNERRRFGIKRRDRRAHMYLVGKTGTGKSTLLENLIASDLRADEGLAVLDPHGDLYERVLREVPATRQRELICFNPASPAQALALNVLERRPGDAPHLIAAGLVSVFKKLWADSWGPRMEYILHHAVLALLDVPGATLADIPRILIDPAFRAAAVTITSDSQVKDFWLGEYERYPDRFRTEAIAPIQNKVGQFLANRIVRAVISHSTSSFSLRQVMGEGRILLVNLAKGRIGEDASRLLGALLLTQIELAALSRANIPQEENRRDFYVYIDEFSSFATASFAGLLTEARKYRVNLILAHQYIEQLEEELCAAVFGNVGTIVAFRLGARDAKYLSREFYPVFTESDLVGLPQHHIYLKLMIDGVTHPAFSAVTLPPTEGNNVS
jgi:hypothetical protein